MNEEKEIIINDLERLRTQLEIYKRFKKLFIPSMEYYRKTLGEAKVDEVVKNLRLFIKYHDLQLLRGEGEEEYKSL